MANSAVCMDREVLIEDASVDEVISFCIQALKGMRLRIEKEESSQEGENYHFCKRERSGATNVEGVVVPFQSERLR
jgi:hypothetical protein